MLFAVTLTLSACGKTETAVMSNSVETEITAIEGTTTEEVKETTNASGSNEMSDEIKNDFDYQDAENPEEYVPTLEEQELIDEALKRQEQNITPDVKAEVEEAMKNDPNAPDPSLTQEELDYIDSLFQGNDDNDGVYYAGEADDPNTTGGVKYFGGTEPW